MNTKKQELLEAERQLREKLRQKRSANVFKLDEGDVVKKIEKIVPPQPQIQPVKPIENLETELAILEKEIDSATNKVVNLAEKHWITPQKVSQLWDLIEAANEADFQPKEIIEALEKWKILNVWLEGFEYFKILKVCTSATGKNICIVNLKKTWWKKWKTDLLIRLPIHHKWTLELYSSKTQELMGRFKIQFIKLNEKTLLEKALWALWF